MTRLIRSSSVSRKLLLLATISALGGLAACGDPPEAPPAMPRLARERERAAEGVLATLFRLIFTPLRG